MIDLNSFFLDSGAFSVMTGKASPDKINIRKYMDFIHKYNLLFDVYSNFDIIGNARKTYQNQKIMESNGLNPLPVYHVGEDFSFLKKYCENYDYLAIGGLVPLSGKPEQKIRLREIWKIAREIKPDIKLHGFGMTIPKLILEWPWYSCDSRTYGWISNAKGRIFSEKLGRCIQVMNKRKEIKRINGLFSGESDTEINFRCKSNFIENSYRCALSISNFDKFIEKRSNVIIYHAGIFTVYCQKISYFYEEMQPDKYPNLLESFASFTGSNKDLDYILEKKKWIIENENN